VRARECSEFTKKGGAVAFDGSTGIVLGKAEIQIALAVSAGKSAEARGETVQQPGDLAELVSAKNGEFGFVRGPGWHRSMLPEGVGCGAKLAQALFFVLAYFVRFHFLFFMSSSKAADRSVRSTLCFAGGFAGGLHRPL
jgi:hypothetical protein